MRIAAQTVDLSFLGGPFLAAGLLVSLPVCSYMQHVLRRSRDRTSRLCRLGKGAVLGGANKDLYKRDYTGYP